MTDETIDTSAHADAGAASSPPPHREGEPMFAAAAGSAAPAEEADGAKVGSQNLSVILGVPVKMQVVLGTATMQVASLLKLGRGVIVELDRKLGEPVAVMINNRMIARGEVVVVENERFGITLTDIVANDFIETGDVIA